MFDEKTRRREDFRNGTAIRLADGQAWVFPAPNDPGEAGTWDRDERQDGSGPMDERLVRAVLEAEDEDDRRRCELALAIHLLSHNYELEPPEYQALLGFEPGSAALAEVQEAFHELARDYAGHLPATPSPESESAGAARGPQWAGSRLWAGRRSGQTINLAGGSCR